MLIDTLQKRLLVQKEKRLIRERPVTSRPKIGECVPKINNRILLQQSGAAKTCINFGSNDYLSLSKHPKIAEALSRAAKQHGFGSGASAFVSGYSTEHRETERQFAEWLKVDEAILFSSGYLANLTVLDALLSRSHKVFGDKLCHASLLDGIRLGRSKLYRYRHCDLSHLRHLVKQSSIRDPNLPNLIVTETIFSMEGDIAPIEDLVCLAKENEADLLIDDAHGIGVLGQNGAGISEHLALRQDQFTCLTLPLGKAFNAMGAIVAGRREIIEIILQFGRPYRYTTALPPAMCKAIRTSLQLVRGETWRRQHLNHNIRFFNQVVKDHSISLVSEHETPIRSLVIPNTSKLLEIQDYLLSRGFYVPAIRPPTVPKNMSRLRISLNCLHTEDEIKELISHIAEKLHA